MPTPTHLALFGLSALLLGACSKDPVASPPTPSAVTTETGSVPSIPTDTSLPSAASAGASGPPTPVREAGRANAPLTRAQESSAMPVAGQNNDHSAPLSSAEPASAAR